MGGFYFLPLDSCLHGNDDGGWCGVVEMVEGAGCVVWVPAFAGMTVWVAGMAELWLRFCPLPEGEGIYLLGGEVVPEFGGLG